MKQMYCSSVNSYRRRQTENFSGMSKKQFLVAIDLKSNHKSPLEWLAETLLTTGDTVHLLTCLDSDAPTDTLDLAGEEDMVRAELQSLLHKCESKTNFSFHSRLHVVSGKPSVKILECSKEIHPTMIIMGSRGRSTLESLVLGSTSLNVLKSSLFPVTILNQSPQPLL